MKVENGTFHTQGRAAVVVIRKEGDFIEQYVGLEHDPEAECFRFAWLSNDGNYKDVYEFPSGMTDLESIIEVTGLPREDFQYAKIKYLCGTNSFIIHDHPGLYQPHNF